MSLRAPFLSVLNFALAFQRIVRGQNTEYKQYYRHALASYNLALKDNLEDLLHNIKVGAYNASPPTVIFSPKPTGVLRPLKLLVIQDLIVYLELRRLSGRRRACG